MKISISTKMNLPIYEQIINQIRDAVVSEELRVGEALPSIRMLAKDLEVSVITIKRAYEELMAEGVIESKQGKGFFVCEQNNDYLKEKQMHNIEGRLADIIAECKSAKMELDDVIELIKLLYE